MDNSHSSTSLPTHPYHHILNHSHNDHLESRVDGISLGTSFSKYLTHSFSIDALPLSTQTTLPFFAHHPPILPAITTATSTSASRQRLSDMHTLSVLTSGDIGMALEMLNSMVVPVTPPTPGSIAAQLRQLQPRCTTQMECIARCVDYMYHFNGNCCR